MEDGHNDQRLVRIEEKLDKLEGQILGLYTNGLSRLGERVSVIEGTCHARQREIATQRSLTGSWLTVVGYLFTVVNSIGIAVLVYLLNNKP